MLSTAFLWGEFRISSQELQQNNSEEEKFITLRIIQPNNREKYLSDIGKKLDTFQKVVKESSQGECYNTNLQNAQNHLTPNYYIWPEGILPFSISIKKGAKELEKLQYAKHFLPKNVGLISGVDLYDLQQEKIFNGIVLINENHQIQDMYKKRILVPFGEYIPWRFILNKLNSVITMSQYDFSPGKMTQQNLIIQDPSQKYQISLAPYICYEAIFPRPFFMNNAKNADLLLNITNDIWFGDSIGPHQHAAMSRMRAIEYNKPLIRVANFGISAFFDQKGRIINKIPINSAGFFDIKVKAKKIEQQN